MADKDDEAQSPEERDDESASAADESSEPTAEASAEKDEAAGADDGDADSNEDADPEASGAGESVSAQVRPARDDTGGGGGVFIGYAGFAVVIAASIGWIMQSDRPMSSEAAETPTSEASGPCERWEKSICDQTGGEAALPCAQVKQAVKLLSPASCQRELASVPATLERVAAAREDCRSLVARLCGDLGEETEKCQMVTAKTPAFPAERCTEMLGKYDEVLSSLQNMPTRVAGQPPRAGGMPHAPGHAMPRSGMPAGMPKMRPMPAAMPPPGAAAAAPVAPPAAAAPQAAPAAAQGKSVATP